MSLFLASRKLACVASQMLFRNSLVAMMTYATQAKKAAVAPKVRLLTIKTGLAQVKRVASPAKGRVVAKPAAKAASKPGKKVATAKQPKKVSAATKAKKAVNAKSKSKAKTAGKPKAKKVAMNAAGKRLTAAKKGTKKVAGKSKASLARTPAKKPATAAKKVKKVAKKAVAVRPKRFSAYNLFVKENYATQGAAEGDKLKALASQWKTLPMDAKNKYVQRSQSDEGLKKRHITGMALYVKENYAKTQNLPKLVEEWKSLSKELKEQYNQRAQKGEGGKVLMTGKRPKGSEPKPKKVSGYAAFIKESYPTLQGSMVERSRLAAAKWKAMSEQQKQAYRSTAKPAKPSAAKPQSGYNLYVQEQVKQNKLAFGTVAAQWKAMTEAQREAYKVRAKSL